MRAVKFLRLPAWTWAVLPFGVLLFIAPARGEPRPLPAAEQTKVDHAIEEGVNFLKTTQQPSGTWATDSNHPVGYAALPALTLLECGVPKSDPVLKRAEKFIRAALIKMDDTYELSLSILFLDKLGNPDDEAMIQGLALRLVAGQSPTGGWGYKCPITSNTETHELFKLLHQLNPKPEKPAGKDPAPTDKSPDDTSKPVAKPPAAPAQVVIPPNLSRLSVVQELSQLHLEDPKDKASEIIFATTDNSDTQFAILALWTAQRHDVPMDRTLRLIANRFQTSQNADGSWGYAYVNGGGAGEGAPMDCCGLLGLAVGHGIARDRQGADNAVQDAKIVSGFAALNKFVGAPAGRTANLPPVNLYFLWSLGRVGVLYDLPTIADKDWYRWGAETLVANQSVEGDWKEGGGYPGATPVVNTCFALLFLRRANLVADLTAALKLNPDDLTQAIAAKVAPTPAPEPPVPAPPPPAPTKPPEPTVADQPAPPPAPTPVASPPTVAPAASPPASPAPAEDGGHGGLVLVLMLVAVLLLAAGGGVLAFHFLSKKKAAEVSKPGKKKPEGKRPGGRAPAGTPAKKPTGKTRPPA